MARGEHSTGFHRAGMLAAAALLALAGCGGEDATPKQASTPTSSGSTPAPAPKPAPAPAPRDGSVPPVDPSATPEGAVPPAVLKQLVPDGVPSRSTGAAADPEQLKVVQRWLAALTNADIEAAADTFADGAVVQNLTAPLKLEDRAARITFNRAFPCGAEASAASGVKGYLIVVYRLTDRKGSGCDGPGGSAASTIKVEKGRMTEWYRLPDPIDDQPQGPGEIS